MVLFDIFSNTNVTLPVPPLSAMLLRLCLLWLNPGFSSSAALAFFSMTPLLTIPDLRFLGTKTSSSESRSSSCLSWGLSKAREPYVLMFWDKGALSVSHESNSTLYRRESCMPRNDAGSKGSKCAQCFSAASLFFCS